ncbi:MAG: DUF1638 domain-containing protein [Deltaproteobacteria bacterium]|nr:DUF1638 domain-containing protein [Deltaproteobacteria bacterium]MBW1908291.1 DUF1638 domain-containing protein [Deltaproteobacteria bacterium]MBW2033237.1 DUF1638 domain-containing protein [Deltaproteobacteria bacterium]MBW2113282.1 DUF1638 domain-containing protein [Deltaproteobacteria bacterium]MBW2357351.1 DUF1638 domain-containing protein [Deltaproteobacteria bacterium]
MHSKPKRQKKGSIVVVACRVMEPELERVRQGKNHVEIRYLDQGLHRTPKDMAGVVQEQIDQAAKYADRIILGYGLCSNGIVGVTARQQGLIVPRCHDCIALFLGSPAAYKEVFEARPGTYYLTPGWVAEKKDPLGIVENDYTHRVGRETAFWVMEEELKHYTHIALIDAGVSDPGPLRERAMENARIFKKEYQEIQGSMDYFKKIIQGPYADEDFFFIKPSSAIPQEIFLE